MKSQEVEKGYRSARYVNSGPYDRRTKRREPFMDDGERRRTNICDGKSLKQMCAYDKYMPQMLYWYLHLPERLRMADKSTRAEIGMYTEVKGLEIVVTSQGSVMATREIVTGHMSRSPMLSRNWIRRLLERRW
jgi:hypothetical protein